MLLGRKDLAEHADYKTNDLRNRNQAKLKTEIEKNLKSKTTDEWIALIGQGQVRDGHRRRAAADRPEPVDRPVARDREQPGGQ